MQDKIQSGQGGPEPTFFHCFFLLDLEGLEGPELEYGTLQHVLERVQVVGTGGMTIVGSNGGKLLLERDISSMSRWLVVPDEEVVGSLGYVLYEETM